MIVVEIVEGEEELGNRVGCNVGNCVGIKVGIKVGIACGVLVGGIVGLAKDGNKVGINVLGAIVGMAVRNILYNASNELSAT